MTTRLTTSRAWYCFDTNTLYCDNATLTQDDYNAIWNALPTTGAAWCEHGLMYVQAFDGAPVVCLGEVSR